MQAKNDDLEVILLGTGTSSSIPHIECLTAGPDDKPCHVCLSPDLRNRRRNTSAVFRVKDKDGQKITILCDVGKNFQAAALEQFPKFTLRKIDAVIITHAHADAMNGLDDLRGWTLGGAIQSHIDVYVSQSTFGEVQRSFPYLADKNFASGGGDVPEFRWHIFEDKVTFEIQETGVHITPFSVHHGRIFSVSPPPGFTPTPYATMPSSPNRSRDTSPTRHSFLDTGSLAKAIPAAKIHPYLCFAFKIEDAVVYMSDVSLIPEDAWVVLETPNAHGALPVLILDCLRLLPHTSHFGVAEALATIRRLQPQRTYLTGFGHEVSHHEYTRLGQSAGGVPMEGEVSAVEKEGRALVGDGEPVWVRPAHDGLRIIVSSGGTVTDETYTD